MNDVPNLEARIARLEAIVRSLDGEGLELETSLALFEEGIGHVREAERLLRESQLRIERLLENADGRLVTEPIEDGE
jgi:exodeoxyribonuclease VII small subunit